MCVCVYVYARFLLSRRGELLANISLIVLPEPVGLYVLRYSPPLQKTLQPPKRPLLSARYHVPGISDVARVMKLEGEADLLTI